MKETIEKINRFLSDFLWMDMEIQGWKGGTLVIAGSQDFSYGHIIEISFQDVGFMSLASEWKTDSVNPVLNLLEGPIAIEKNKEFNVEEGSQVVQLKAKYFDLPFYVSTKGIEFNTDRVYYYQKTELKDGERIADWVG